MSLHLLPGRNLLIAIGVATAIALLLCVLNMLTVARWLSALTLLMLITLSMIDWHHTKHAWRIAALSFSRRLPAAFALGVKCNISISLVLGGERSWSAQFIDHSDASLNVTDNMPVKLLLQPDKHIEFSYTVTPTQRGEVIFSPAALRFES